MKLGEAAWLFSAYAAWRATGAPRAGRVVLKVLSSPDETNRTAAGVLLARAGRRALPLLHEALGRKEVGPMTLRVLGEVGDASVRADLEPHLSSSDPRIARAAQDALRALDARLQTGR
jgi:HEAT repeat protein